MGSILMKSFFRRLRYWITSRRADSELAEELEFHRAMKQQQFEHSGLDSNDAAAESRRALGNVLRAREESRDVWGWTWLSDVFRDVHYAWRTLARMPLLAGVVIVSLGIGIGVNASVFSWIEAAVLRPIPGIEDPSAFFLVEARSDTGSYPGMSWQDYKDLRKNLRSFQDVLAFRGAPVNLGNGDRAERRYALLASDNYFSGLGLRPVIGRLFTAEDSSLEHPGIVISHGFWKAQFGADPAVLGRTLRVNDQTVTIIGVLPEGFQGTVLALEFDLWAPADLAPLLFGGTRELDDRSQRAYSLMGKLRPGVTLTEANAEVRTALKQLAAIYPEVNANFSGEVLPYWRAPRGPQQFLISGLALLQGLMLLLLVAVCGNTANLLLARTAARSREIGTRLAIGATRLRIVRLLITEDLMLGLAGAAIGVIIAFWGTEALRAARLSTMLPIKFQTAIDFRVLIFCAALGIVCAVAFGLAPALHVLAGSTHAKLHSHFNARPQTRVRKVLMATEAALALMVLMAAGLFFESFRDAKTSDPGFQVEGVLLSTYDLSTSSASHLQPAERMDPAISRSFADQLLEKLRAVTGVESAAIAAYVPLDIHGLPLRPFVLEGRAANTASPDRALVNFVTPGYFRTMGIPQVAGTDFVPLSDNTTEPQVIVNEEFVRRYAADIQPIGRHVQTAGKGYVIAGVVRNSYYDAFGESPIPLIYFSYRDRPRASGEIHVRTRPGRESLLAGEVRRAAREVDGGLPPLFNVRSLTDHIETNLFLRRIPARLFIVLGPLLLLFAAIGVYSVVAYSVSHRITEIGVRIALGAGVRNVVAQIVGENMKVIVVGTLSGFLISFVVYIHVVPGGPIDPRVFLGIPAILLAVAAAASWLPARRSASVDPMVALRHE
jgi:predicted permease